MLRILTEIIDTMQEILQVVKKRAARVTGRYEFCGTPWLRLSYPEDGLRERG